MKLVILTFVGALVVSCESPVAEFPPNRVQTVTYEFTSAGTSLATLSYLTKDGVVRLSQQPLPLIVPTSFNTRDRRYNGPTIVSSDSTTVVVKWYDAGALVWTQTATAPGYTKAEILWQ